MAPDEPAMAGGVALVVVVVGEGGPAAAGCTAP